MFICSVRTCNKLTLLCPNSLILLVNPLTTPWLDPAGLEFKCLLLMFRVHILIFAEVGFADHVWLCTQGFLLMILGEPYEGM